MEIVINIPEKLIKTIKCPANNWSCSNPILDQAIKEGIILPKGHADLVSVTDVTKAVDNHTFDSDKGLVLDDDITCILENVDVIIPADK